MEVPNKSIKNPDAKREGGLSCCK